MHLEANFLVQANFAFPTPTSCPPSAKPPTLILKLDASAQLNLCWLKKIAVLVTSASNGKPFFLVILRTKTFYLRFQRLGFQILLGTTYLYRVWVYYWSKLISCLNGQEDGASDVTSLQSESQAHTPMKNISNTNFPTGSQDIFHGLPNVLLLHFCQLRVVRNCFAKQLSRCCLQIKVISRLKP